MKVRGSGHSANLRRSVTATAVASCFAYTQGFAPAHANPTGAAVKHGTATLQQSGGILQITNSPNAVIHWQGFSIDRGELTRFIQQNPQSAVLNRVIGASPSAILGALHSNGRVFLINPNGILFGAGAQINVSGLVASSLNLTDADFIAGRLRFGPTPGAGAVVNEGAITTPSGGQVYLIAPNVQNSGVITTPKGEVILAAGATVEMADTKTPLLRVEVTAPENEAVNAGKIIAEGGRVSVYGTAIRNSGTISANTLVRGENGEILLRAKKDVTLEKSSVITASGPSAGKITIEAETGAAQIVGRIEANAVSAPPTHPAQTTSPPLGRGAGETGGVGEKGGEITIRAQREITVDAQATIAASGPGGGGTVTLNSASGTTRIAGAIEARAADTSPPLGRGAGEAGGVGAVGSAAAGGTLAITADKLSVPGSLKADGASGGHVTIQANQIVQSGTITADATTGKGGVVDLRAVESVVQEPGAVVSASSAAGDGGAITIMAGSAGRVVTSAALAVTAGGIGGAITVTAKEVELRESNVDASGDRGGGLIRLGGDYQGKGTIPNARRLTVDRFTRIRADAEDEGDGGRVILWSDDLTEFQGEISARGGSLGGDGGFAEVSGKALLRFEGTVDLEAPHGRGGTLLLDPKFINISNFGTLNYFPGDNTFDAFADQTTQLAASAIVGAVNAGTNVVLEANTDISVDATIVAGGSGSLTLRAGRSIAFLTGSSVALNTGDFSATINDAGAQPGSRDAGVAQFTMAPRSSITTSGSVAITRGNFGGVSEGEVLIQGGTLTTGTAINIAGSSRSGAGVFNVAGVRIDSGSKITATGSGTITISGQGQGSVDAALNHGVVIDGLSTQIIVQHGTLAITGAGGTGPSGGGQNEGVRVSSNAMLHATGDGAITIDGIGGTGGSFNAGVRLLNSFTEVDGAGGLTITGTRGGGSGSNQGIRIEGATIQSQGTGTMQLTAPGTGVSTGNDDHGIFLLAGALVESLGGSPIVLQGTGGAGGGMGVYLTSSSTINSLSGNINVTGTGGTGGSGLNNGIYLESSSAINGSGVSNITLTGNRGASSNLNFGIGVFGSTVTTAGVGTISMTGGGSASVTGSDNYGIVLGLSGGFGGVVDSTRNITLNGTGGNGTSNNYGVLITGSGSRVTVGGGFGAINITGTGGSGTGTGNNGIVVQAGGKVQNNAGGAVTLTGTGPATAGDQIVGISLSDSGTDVYATFGKLTLIGNAGTHTNSAGVDVRNSATVRGANSGDVEIIATGGEGLYLDMSGQLSTGTGSMLINATGLTAGNGFGAVELRNGAGITSTGGSIGITASPAANQAGLQLTPNGVGATIGGPLAGGVSIAVAGGGSTSFQASGVPAIIQSASDVTLHTDTISGSSVVLVAPNVTLRPNTPSRSTVIETGTTAGVLSLKPALLQSVTAPNTLALGRNDSTSDLTHDAALTLSNVGTLSLLAGDDIILRNSIAAGNALVVGLNANDQVSTPSGSSVTLNGSGGQLIARVNAGRTWSNSSTVTLSGDSLIALPDTNGDGTGTFATFSNNAGATLNVGSSATWSFLSHSSSQGGILNNAGVLNVTQATAWEAAFTNAATGTLNISGSQVLSLQNGKTVQGVVDMAPGGVLWVSERHGTNTSFNGTIFTGSGQLRVGPGIGPFPVADLTNVSAGTTILNILNGGTVNVLNGTSTFQTLTTVAGAAFSLSNATYAQPAGGLSVPVATYSGNVGYTVGGGGNIGISNPIVTTGTITLQADDISVGAAVTSTAGDARLRPNDPARDIRIETIKLPGALSLSPAQLQNITTPITGTLEIGRSDGTGTLTTTAPIASSNINAGTLKLFGNDINLNASIGGIGAEFTHNLELRAGKNANATIGSIFLANDKSLTLRADNDSNGVGQVNIGGVNIKVGSDAANTVAGSMSIQGQDIFMQLTSGAGSVVVTGAGAQTFTAADSITFDNVSGTGNIFINTETGPQSFITSTGAMRILGGTSADSSSSVSSAAGSQSLTLGGGLTIQAGTGTGAVANLISTSAQTISAKFIEVIGQGGNAGNLALNGGATGNQSITTTGMNAAGEGIVVKNLGTAPFTQIGNFGTGTQTITVNNADRVRVIGDVGTASISSPNADQTVLIKGSDLNALEIGSATAAHSSSVSGRNQSITAGEAGQNGSITLTGGVADTRNASISGSGVTQTVFTAGDILAVGGTASGTAGSDGSISHSGTGLQSITAREIRLLGGASGTFNSGVISASNPSGTGVQTVTARNIEITGRTGGHSFITTSQTNGGQSITTSGQNAAGEGIAIRSLAPSGTFSTGIFNSGTLSTGQTLTVNNADKVVVAGVGGNAGIDSNAAQTLKIVGSGQNRLEVGAAGATGSSFVNASGTQIVNAGTSTQPGSIVITGGAGESLSARIIQDGTFTANQTVTTTGLIDIRGGTAPGTLTPGVPPASGTTSGGSFGQIRNQSTTGSQTIEANGIVLNGGTANINNQASIRTEADQTVTVGSGGITLFGGSGEVGNHATIRTFGPNGTQTINVGNGGTIHVRGGSSTNADSDGPGSDGAIRADGVQQTINFGSNGTLRVDGGSVGAGNKGDLIATAGTQTITGSPTVSLKGGPTGGLENNTNSARIVNQAASGQQNLTLGPVTLTGGDGGTSNAATITAANQVIGVTGDLNLSGGTGTTLSSGARIGGYHNSNDPTLDTHTNLALTASGSTTLTGGVVSGASIGSSRNSGGKTNTITLTSGGDITLNPNTSENVRIGSPFEDIQTGTLVVTSTGGNIALNSAGGLGTTIRTLGNVTLTASGAGKSITAGAESFVQANTLTASAGGNITLNGNNQVGNLVVTTGGGNVSFNNTQALTLGNNWLTTPAGAQTISITTTGATSDITIAGSTTTNDNITLNSGHDILFSGANVTANSLTLNSTGGGSALFNTGTSTLTTPATSNVALSVGGGTLNLNGATQSTAPSLTVTSGTVNINDGALAIGGNVTNSGTINVKGTGPATPIALLVGGDLTLNSSGNLGIELGGAAGGPPPGTPNGNFGAIDITGTVNLGGTLTVTTNGTFTPSPGDKFDFLQYGAQAGDFATVVNNTGVSVNLSKDADRLQFTAGSPQNRWIVNGGGVWNLGSNWSRGTVPESFQDVVIPDIGTVGANFTITVDAAGMNARTVTSSEHLTVSSGALTIFGPEASTVNGTLTISGSGSLTANGPLTAAGGLSLTGGTLGGGGTVTLNGAGNWTGGNLNGTGKLVVGAGGNLTLSGGTARSIVGGYDIDNLGIVTATHSATITATGTPTTVVTNSGVWNANHTGLFGDEQGGGSFRFVNSAGGIVNRTAAGSGTILNAENNGALNVQSGTLTFDNRAGFTSGGTFSINAGATLAFVNGSHTVTGAFAAGTGAGTLSLSSTTLNIGANVTIDDAVLIPAGATLSVNAGSTAALAGVTLSGTLGGAGNATVSGPFTWSTASAASDITGTGTLTTSGTSILSGAGVNSHRITGGRIWNNTGSAALTGGHFSINSGATFGNSGAVAVTTASAIGIDSNGTGTNTFNNSGTINWNTPGAAGVSVVTAFNNTGSINVTGGTMNVSAPFTQSGVLQVGTGATFQKSAGFISTGTVQGTGTVLVGTGASALTNRGTLRAGTSPGTLNITGDLVLDGAAGSVTEIEIAGTGVGQFDVINVTGTVSGTGAGNLNWGTINVSNGTFTPAPGNSFTIVNYGSRVGDFTTKNLAGYTETVNTGNYVLALGGGTKQWAVDADGFWDVGSNWTGGTAPIAGDNVEINRSGGTFTVTVRDITGAGAQFAGTLVMAGNEKLVVEGDTLTLGSGTSSINDLLTVSGGTLSNAGSLTAQMLTLSGGTVTNSGTGSALSIGTLTTSSGTLSGAGSVSVTSAYNRSGGTFNIGGSASINQASGALNLANPITASGLTLNTGGGTIGINTGATLNMNSGTLAIMPAAGANLGGGTISNAIVTNPSGLGLTLSANSTLSNVTLDTDVTVPNARTLTLGGTSLTIASGRAVRLQSSGSNTILNAATNYTINGPGSILFEGTSANNRIEGNTLLTLPAGLVIGGAGSGSITSVATLDNATTIQAIAPGQTITVSPIALNNTGTLQALGGGTLELTGLANQAGGTVRVNDAGSVLTLNGTWSNPAGTLQVQGGTVNLDGTFSNLGSFNRTGGTAGTVNLTGTFNNTGSTFVFDSTVGVMNLNTGTVSGGTLRKSGSGDLVMTGNGTLTNLTLDMDFVVPNARTLTLGGTSLTIASGRAVRLQSSGSNTALDAATNYTINGPGSILFEGTSANNRIEGNTLLTLPAGLVIGGAGSGSITSVATLNNATTIQAIAPGQTITVSPTTLNNTGTLQALGGGTLELTGLANQAGGTVRVNDAGSVLTLNGTWSNPAGTLQVQGGTVNLDGTFSNLGSFNRTGGTAGTVNLTGTFNNTGSTFVFDSTVGVMNLNTGTVSGGTLRKSGSGDLVITGNGTLTNLTLDMDFVVPNARTLTLGGTSLTIASGRAVRLQSSGSNTALDAATNYTINGPGSILFEGTSANNRIEGNTLLTLPAGLVIGGTGSGSITSVATLNNATTLQAIAPGQTITVSPITLNNTGTLRATGGGNLTVDGLATNAGMIDIGAGSTFSTSNNNLTNTSTGTIQGSGRLLLTSGTAITTGRTLTNNGTLAAGNSPGTLNIVGDLVLTGTSRTNIEIANTGTAGVDYDLIAVTGTATLGGTLTVTHLGTFTPNVGASFAVMSYAAATSDFAVKNFPVAYTSTVGATSYGLGFNTPGTKTWISTLSGNWNDGGNWSGGTVPTETDEVTINQAAALVITVQPGATQRAFRVTSDEDLLISGGTLLLGGGASSVNGTVTLSSGTLTNAGALTMGTLAMSGGTLNGAGSVAVTNAYNRNGGTFSIGGAASITQATGALTLGQITAGSIAATAQAGSLVAGGALSSPGTITLVAQGASSDVSVSGSITGTGDNALIIRADNSVLFTSGADVTATSNLIVTLNADRDGSGAGAIALGSGTVISSGGGSIFLGGGLDPQNVAARGTAANVAGITLDGAELRTSGGQIRMHGQGAGGVSNAHGILADNGSVIESANGSILLSGIGGASAAASRNMGVQIINNGTVRATTSGDVTINGTGGSGQDHAVGVNFEAGGRASTVNGSIQVTGQGGSGGNNSHIGTRIFGGSVTAGGAGSITINGTGGSSSNVDLFGVTVESGGIVSAASGNITITGTGGSGTGNNHAGVYINSGGQVLSAGSGSISLTGSGTGGAFGIQFANNLGAGTNTVGGVDANGDIVLTSVSATGIALGGDNAVIRTSAARNVTLNATNGGGVSQTSGSITAGGLRVLGLGGFSLNQSGNDVTTLAADLGGAGALSYRDANALNIGTVLGTTGLNLGGAASNTVTINAGGDIAFNAGSITAPQGVTLSTTGNIVNNIGGGTQIDTSGANGAISLTGANIGTSIASRLGLNPGTGTVAVTANGNAFVEHTVGELIAGGRYTLSSAAAGATLRLSTTDGRIVFNSTGVFAANTTDDSIFIATGGTDRNIEHNGDVGWSFTGAPVTYGTTGSGGQFSIIAGTTTFAGAAAIDMPASVPGGTTLTFNNTAALQSLSLAGTLTGSGNVTLASGGTSTWTGGTMSGTGTTTVASGATLNAGSAGTLTATRPFTNQGAFNVNGGAVSLTGAFTQSGTLQITNGATFQKSSGFTNAGVVGGSGTIDVTGGALLNQGTLRAGSSPGTLRIGGNLALTGNSVTEIEISNPGTAGHVAGTHYDLIAVTGTVSGAAGDVNNWGTLNVTHVDGFVPGGGLTFNVMTYTGRTGDFTTKRADGAAFPGVHGYTGAANATSYLLATSGVGTNNWINPLGGDWNTPSNWSLNEVPTATQLAIINIGTADFAVTYSNTGTQPTVGQLQNAETLRFTGGTLTLAGNSSSTGQLDVAGGTLVIGETPGVNLTAHTLNLSSGAVSGTGSLNVTNAYTHTGGTVSIGGGASITQASGDLALGAVTAAGITARAVAGNLSLNGGLSSTADITLASSGNFVNNAGASALSAGGRWLVWSQNPANDTRGGLAYDFKQYNANFGTTTVQGAGNGFLYALAPTITPSLTSPVVKVYDGTTAATLAPANYAVSGAVDGDIVTLNNPTAGNYDTANFGTGKNVTVSGVAIASATDGAATVLGYQLASTTAGGNVGTINQAALTLTAVTDTKVYDGTTISAATPATSGLVAGDTVSGLAQVFDSRNAGPRTLSLNPGFVVSDGNGGGNYNVVTNTATGTITPRSLTATGLLANDKVYDGNTAATLNIGGAALTGVVGVDAVNLNATGSTAAFADRHVGTAKTVTITGLSLVGLDAGNYTVAPAPGALSASITQLGTVAWVGGPSGNWSLASNWAGGALPDRGNVANVVIPAGSTVNYDLASAANGTTTLTTLSSSGTLQMTAGALSIATSLSTAGYQQSSGSVTGTGSFTATQSFGITGGSLNMGGTVNAIQASGNMVIGAPITGSAVTLSALAGDIVNAAGGGTQIDTSAANGPITLSAAAIGAAGSGRVGVNPGSGTVTATATSGGIFLEQTAGNLPTSQYLLSATGSTQSISLATTDGAINVDTIAGFNGNTANDVFSLTTAGMAKDIVFSDGISLTAAGLGLAGTGRALFNAGTVTLNTPVTATLPLNIDGATVDFNGALSSTAVLNLVSGTLMGTGGLRIDTAWNYTAGNVDTTLTLASGSASTLGNGGTTTATMVTVTGSGKIVNKGTLILAGVMLDPELTNFGPPNPDPTNSGGGTLKTGAGTTNVLKNITANTNDGTIDLGSLSVLEVPGALTNNGMLKGSGTLKLGNAGTQTLTNDGWVAPGTSPGILVIDGNFVQGPNGNLAIEVEVDSVTASKLFDVLDVTGTVSLAGNLHVMLLNGSRPAHGDSITIMQYRPGAGAQDSVNAIPPAGYTIGRTLSGSSYTITFFSTAEQPVVPLPPPLPSAAAVQEVVEITTGSLVTETANLAVLAGPGAPGGSDTTAAIGLEATDPFFSSGTGESTTGFVGTSASTSSSSGEGEQKRQAPAEQKRPMKPKKPPVCR